MPDSFRFLTEGESHGEALTAVIDGVPAGLALGKADINADLARRQRGYGRGGRMKIERDQVRIHLPGESEGVVVRAEAVPAMRGKRHRGASRSGEMIEDRGEG